MQKVKESVRVGHSEREKLNKVQEWGHSEREKLNKVQEWVTLNVKSCLEEAAGVRQGWCNGETPIVVKNIFYVSSV